MKTFALLSALLWFALPCRAEDAASPATRLEEILRRADAEDPAVRRAAGAELDKWCEETGDAAEELLRKASPGRSPEVRNRIEAALGPFVQTAEDRKVLSMFATLGMPDVKGLKYVRFNTGEFWVAKDRKRAGFVTVRGWVVDVSEKTITLATDELEVTTLPRKRQVPDDWEALKTVCENPEPGPGEFRDLDFEGLMKAGLDAPVIGFFGGGEGAAMGPALMAWWAYQRGDRKSGRALLQKALDSLEKLDEKEERSAGYKIATAAANHLKIRLISAAHHGMARAELLASWKRVQALPENAYSDIARTMAAGYEAQCREDADFKELPAEELAKRTPAERAAYWVHLLRDVDASQWSDPGSVSVVGFGSGRRDPEDKRPWPPSELVALGYDAIPALIEHLDDTGPTRSMGWWRSFAANSWYLLTMADACEQVFRAITGLNLYERDSSAGTMTRDGKAAEVKKAAQEWWETAKNKSPEDRLLDLLPENLVKAAGELLRTYGKKHLARVVEEVSKRPDHTGNLVSELWEVLGPEHADVLRAMLKAKDGFTLTNAASALARVANDVSGVQEIARRLKAGERGDHFDGIDLGTALPLLARHARKEGLEIVLEKLASGEERPDRDLFECAPLFADPKVLEALQAWFERKEETGTYYGDGYKPRWCDDAAEAAAKMTGWPQGWRHSLDASERNGWIRDLKSWIGANEAKFDWEALQKKALEKPEGQ